LKLFGETRTRHLVVGELPVFQNAQPHTGCISPYIR
jgi:hypothetical protein